MKKLLYKKVNAFTSDVSFGNPASYLILGKDSLTSDEMLRVGKEQKGYVSEVVFCEDSDVAEIKLTYYSSECEVAFCGHGTIATMYDLIRNNKSWLEKKTISIETNRKGVLTVYNSIKEDDAIFITAPKPQELEMRHTANEIANILGIEKSYISCELPIDCINAGLRTLVVPINNYDKEISMFPDEANMKEFALTNDIDIIVVFSKASNDDFIAHTRVFAPRFGYLEDPATGTGNSAFAYYMLKNSLWDGNTATIEQGGKMSPFNPVKIKVDNGNILFGGSAKMIIEGTYFL